ncbi:hypothetical protein V8D89_008190 [Ganoderma adspersum]
MSRRRRAPSSTRPSIHSDTIPPSVWEGVDEDTGLDIPADRLRRHLQIPDITTRSGLRQVHANFEQINRCLDEAYVAALSRGVPEGAMLVLIIWTKMTADAILRQRLIRTGLVQKIIPLLKTSPGGEMVEELTKMFVESDEEFAMELFRHNMDIVKILRDHSDDTAVVDPTIMTLSQSFSQPIILHRSSHPDILDHECLIPVLSALLDTLRNPPELLPEFTLNVAMIILARVPRICPKRCRIQEIPSLFTYYAALSRSRRLRTRGNAVASILLLAREDGIETGRIQFAGNSSGDTVGRAHASQEDLLSAFPEDLRSRLLTYGADASECVVKFRAGSDAASAISQYRSGDDLCALGLRLAELVQLTEGVIDRDAKWYDMDGSELTHLDLLLCYAASLAERQGSVEQDAADVLKLHYLTATQADPRELYFSAQAAMERNPDLAYAHYVHAMCYSSSRAHIDDRLRTITEAVVCYGQTPFLRCELIARGVVVVGWQALATLPSLMDISQELEQQAMEYFRQVIYSADAYTRLAPPDARQLPAILSWYVVLKLVTERHDLSHYEPLLETIRTAERFAEILHRDRSPAKTDIQLAREWLFEPYGNGSTQQWDRLIMRLDEMDDNVSELVSTPEGPAAAMSFASITANNVRLDQCSWCKNSTVSVKKCSRCREAR